MNTIILIGTPIIRSVIGWANGALADSKVTIFEWKKLIQTVLRVGIIEVALVLGLGGFGIDIPVFATAGTAYLVDLLFSALKKNVPATE